MAHQLFVQNFCHAHTFRSGRYPSLVAPHQDIAMKVFVAVVASVNDYRKGIEPVIDLVSVHTNKEDATEAVMNALIKVNPDNIAVFPVDWSSMTGPRELTQDQLNRLYSYMKFGSIQCDLEGDDVPEDQDEFEKFKVEESAAIAKFAKKIRDHLKNADKVAFTKLEIPELPEGEYIFHPIAWCIHEQNFDVEDNSSDTKDEDLNTKKRAKKEA